MGPDPAIFVIDLQEKTNLKKKVFLLQNIPLFATNTYDIFTVLRLGVVLKPVPRIRPSI
jgi:hypothetical protein